MNKICTSLEQSRKLIELGVDVDTSDMVYLKSYFEEDEDYNLLVGSYHEGYLEKDDGSLVPIFDEHIPAWSLSALMELMNRNCYNVSLNCHGAEWNVKFDDSENYKAFTKDYSVDAAFEMIVWLKENGKI